MIVRNGSIFGILDITIIPVIVTDIALYITLCVNYGLNIEFINASYYAILFIRASNSIEIRSSSISLMKK